MTGSLFTSEVLQSVAERKQEVPEADQQAISEVDQVVYHCVM